MGRFAGADGKTSPDRPTPPRGAALYLRVSTVRQLRGDVSVPSQRKAALQHCEQIGKVVIDEFVDGASGTDDSRPGFQRMLAAALAPNCPFDTILVYSLSRFYRSGPKSELLIRKLRKEGIHVLSVTQPIGDDSSQSLLRQMIGALDEHTSKENGKNVKRALLENARQGFWNGSTPPLGYRTVEGERRGIKIKKKLEVDPVEAELIATIYDLYLNGLPGRGPLGVKEVVKILNARGYRT